MELCAQTTCNSEAPPIETHENWFWPNKTPKNPTKHGDAEKGLDLGGRNTFGTRSEPVRDPFGVIFVGFETRSEPVRNPFGTRSGQCVWGLFG